MEYGISRRVLALALVALVAAPAARGEGEAPAGVVGRLHEALIGVLREAETLGFDGRFARLGDALDGIYDFPTMTRLAVGRAWTDATDDQRRRLTKAFRAMSIATYARRFDGWTGQRFEALDERALDDGGVVVRTILTPGAGEEPIELDYRLRQGDAGWRIVDVYLTGTVSELATRRAEFASVLRDEGLDGLIAALEAKAGE